MVTGPSDASIGPVALFIPSFAGGGAERANIELARALCASNLDVELITPKADGQLTPLADGSGARIVDLTTERVRHSVRALARHLRNRDIAALISSPNETVFYAHLARMLARKPEMRLVGVMHNSWSLHPSETDFRGRLALLALKWVLGRIDLVVCVTQGVKEDLLATIDLDEDPVVIPNPVDITSIVRNSKEPPGHPWLDGTGRIVLGVGRLAWQKDFTTLVKAFTSVTDEFPDAKLLLLGEGELRPVLEKLIVECGLSGQAQLLGFVNNPWSYMANSSVLAMSSRFEGLGLVLVEALACGTPVVATDCPGGPAEVLDNGRLGRLVPVGDANAMATALIEVLAAPPPPVDSNELEKAYSPKSVAKKYIDAIGTLR